MPLPILEKTYQLSVNNVVPTQLELPFHQELIHGIKEAFIGFATLPMTVIGSSDSLAASMDGTDRWIVKTDLVWGTGAHAWIVLQQGAGGAQICIDLNTSGASQPERGDVMLSPGGNFTGGSTTARPTAVDEVEMTKGAYLAGNQTGTPLQNTFHVWHSTDGLIDRVAIFKTGNMHTVWRVEPIENTRVAHTNNPTLGVVTGASNSSADITLTNLRSAAYSPATEKDGTGIPLDLITATLGGTSFISFLEQLPTIAEEWDNEFFALEEHFISIVVGSRGPKGSAIDSWLGQTAIYASGDTFPVSTTVREFVAIGPWIWPWTGDATIPQVS